MFGIMTLVLANDMFFLPAMFALTFRKLILKVWRTGVDLLCSALFALGGGLILFLASLFTTASSAGNLGGILLGEFAAEHLNPMIVALLFAFAMTLIFLIDYYLYGTSPMRTRRFFYRPSRLVARLRDAVEAFNRPRFILLQ